MKRKSAFTALLLLLFSLLFCCGAAAEEYEILTDELEINPLYADVLSEEDLRSAEDLYGDEAAICSIDGESEETETFCSDEIVYYDSMEAAAASVYDLLESHTAEITIYYEQEEPYYKGMATELFHAAFVHTGVPTQGDYIRWAYGGFTTDGISYNQSGDYYRFTVNYIITWYTDAAQEAALSQKIDEILGELDLDNEPDYIKVMAIYGYLTEHVSYDYENVNDDSYTLKYTAYAALIEGASVCQGYSMAMYRLCLASGIDCRAIKCRSMDHIWNIAEINGTYYLLDATWDAGKDGYEWDYFLKTQAEFSGHLVGDNYGSDFDETDFSEKYPVSENPLAFDQAAAGEIRRESSYETCGVDMIFSEEDYLWYPEIIPPLPQLLTSSITLDGGIRVNFYAKIRGNGSLMLGDTCISAGEGESLGDDEYKISFPISPKEINDVFEIRAFRENGKETDLLDAYGVEFESIRWSLSAYRDGADAGDENLMALIDALSEYGYYAAAYFDGESNVGASSLPEKDVFEESEAKTEGLLPDGLSYEGFSLLLKDNSALRLYFLPTSGSGEKLSFTVDGVEREATEKDGFLYIETDPIPPSELDKSHVFTVSDGENSWTMTAGAFSYCREACNTGSEGLSRLCRSLYTFSSCAKTYFEEKDE